MPPRPSADELDRIDQTLTAGPASRSWPAPDIAHTAGLGAAVHETHIGIVLLLGDRAYKLKKPVRTPFLDFSTREQRLAALQQELRLNWRLAPASTSDWPMSRPFPLTAVPSPVIRPSMSW
jgi:hypothetical protein